MWEQPFQFQPGSLNAFPVLGAGLGGLVLSQIPLLLLPAIPAIVSLLLLLAGSAALALLALGIGAGTLALGAERRQDANLIATRAEAPIRRWIVAHVDTKAQGHSMAGRLIAVWICVLCWAVLVGLSLSRLIAGTPPPVGGVIVAAVLGIAGGGLAARGRLQGTSPGARDNGTGLLAALTAARETRDPSLGFLFTGAEEFGMVGARAFVPTITDSGPTEVVNLDTLADRGTSFIVSHSRTGAALTAALEPHLQRLPVPLRRRRLPIGILVDSFIFARAGVPAVTLARLDWHTLRLVHTPADLPEQLDLSYAESVGRALAAIPSLI